MFIVVLACLGLPFFVLLFSFFSLPCVMLAMGGLVMLVFRLYHTWLTDPNSRQLQLTANKALPLLLIVIILVITTVSVPFYSTDWLKNFAFFNLLVDNDWPPVFSLYEESYVLRYGLGWYVLPALLVKLAGTEWMSLALCMWTAMCLFFTLLLAFENVKKNRTFAYFCVRFFFCSLV